MTPKYKLIYVLLPFNINLFFSKFIIYYFDFHKIYHSQALLIYPNSRLNEYLTNCKAFHIGLGNKSMFYFLEDVLWDL